MTQFPFAQLFALIALIVISAATSLVVNGLNDHVRSADVAVVLGNKVDTTGEPSARLRARLNKALDLYKDDMFSNIIVSGAVGKEGFDEAIVMKSYLIANGVQNEDVYVDGQGLTTARTASNAASLMQRHNWQSALIVSQYFHISRTQLAFERNGISPVYSAHADFFELRDLYSIPREVVAYAAYWLGDS